MSKDNENLIDKEIARRELDRQKYEDADAERQLRAAQLAEERKKKRMVEFAAAQQEAVVFLQELGVNEWLESLREKWGEGEIVPAQPEYFSNLEEVYSRERLFVDKVYSSARLFTHWKKLTSSKGKDGQHEFEEAEVTNTGWELNILYSSTVPDGSSSVQSPAVRKLSVTTNNQGVKKEEQVLPTEYTFQRTARGSTGGGRSGLGVIRYYDYWENVKGMKLRDDATKDQIRDSLGHEVLAFDYATRRGTVVLPADLRDLAQQEIELYQQMHTEDPRAYKYKGIPYVSSQKPDVRMQSAPLWRRAVDVFRGKK